MLGTSSLIFRSEDFGFSRSESFTETGIGRNKFRKNTIYKAQATDLLQSITWLSTSSIEYIGICKSCDCPEFLPIMAIITMKFAHSFLDSIITVTFHSFLTSKFDKVAVSFQLFLLFFFSSKIRIIENKSAWKINNLICALYFKYNCPFYLHVCLFMCCAHLLCGHHFPMKIVEEIGLELTEALECSENGIFILE